MSLSRRRRWNSASQVSCDEGWEASAGPGTEVVWGLARTGVPKAESASSESASKASCDCICEASAIPGPCPADEDARSATRTGARGWLGGASATTGRMSSKPGSAGAPSMASIRCCQHGMAELWEGAAMSISMTSCASGSGKSSGFVLSRRALRIILSASSACRRWSSFN